MQRVAQMKQQLQLMKSLSNPKEMINQMLRNNPNASEINRLIKENNGDIEQAFRTAAKEKGIDPEIIIKALQ